MRLSQVAVLLAGALAATAVTVAPTTGPAAAVPSGGVASAGPRVSLVVTATDGRVEAVATLTPPRPGRTVVLQDRRGDRWVRVASARTGPAGSAALQWSAAEAGGHRLRAALPGGAGGPTATSPWARPTVTAPTPVRPAAPTADVVGVRAAGGVRQFVDCRGSGGPTLVLIAGRYGWSKDWAGQVGEWRRHTRVCAYDRPGLGASPPRPRGTVVDAGMHADELRALLASAGEPGPFLLVGHSYGGQIARAFLHRFHGDVAGVALLDAVPAYWQDVDPGYPRLREEAGSLIDSDRSSAALGGTAPLAHVPLLVVTAGRSRTGAGTGYQGRWAAEQHRLAAASTDSLELLAPAAAHQLQVYAPQVTLRSVLTLLRAVRSATPLPRCPGEWSSWGARCIPRG